MMTSSLPSHDIYDFHFSTHAHTNINAYIDEMGIRKCSAPSHYLKQCWVIRHWTLAKTFRWNFNQNTTIYIEENAFKNVCEMATILSRLPCIKSSVGNVFFNCLALSGVKSSSSRFMQSRTVIPLGRILFPQLIFMPYNLKYLPAMFLHPTSWIYFPQPSLYYPSIFCVLPAGDSHGASETKFAPTYFVITNENS